VIVERDPQTIRAAVSSSSTLEEVNIHTHRSKLFYRMPAKRTEPDQLSKSKSAPFKPPSRVGKTGASKASTKDSVSKPYARGSKATTSHNAAQSAAHKRALAVAPESSLLDSYVDSDEEDIDDSTVQQTRRTSGVRTSTMGLETEEDHQPVMPEALLTRLLYEGFEDKGTKVGKEAMKVVGKYVETFVREAVARAQLERAEEAGDGLGEGFLQVSLFHPSRARIGDQNDFVLPLIAVELMRKST
jgi:hypothetical protein